MILLFKFVCPNLSYRVIIVLHFRAILLGVLQNRLGTFTATIVLQIIVVKSIRTSQKT